MGDQKNPFDQVYEMDSEDESNYIEYTVKVDDKYRDKLLFLCAGLNIIMEDYCQHNGITHYRAFSDTEIMFTKLKEVCEQENVLFEIKEPKIIGYLS